MSLKSKLLASAAALTLAGGVGMGGLAMAGTANAATPSCGDSCIDIFSHDFGSYGNPGFLLDVYKRGQNVGQPIILFRISNADPALDFTISDQGSVADFFAAGLVSSELNLHYTEEEAFEIEYAPYGADTGLCVGVAATAVQGEKVSLQPCGVSSKTVWVEDISIPADATLGTVQEGDPSNQLSIPLINGSDTNFSHPFVLTYPSGSFPTDNPRPQLYVSNLTGFAGAGAIPPSSLGVVSDTQLFNVTYFGQVF